MADVSTSDRYERGLKKMSEVYGVDGGEVVAPLRDLGRYMVEFPYGDAGFPTAINAMNLLHTVLAERNGGSKTT